MPFTRKLPKGSKRIVVLAGQTFRGTKHFYEITYDVSSDWARHLVKTGVARLHEDSQK